MAGHAEAANSTGIFESSTHIPIAQLTPLLTAPSSRSVKAVVTLTWPYSSATGSVAFLLAEPDFRLRRTKGQVRVQFSGSSARSVQRSGIASGDEVILCLDGVEWIQDDSETVTPGRGVGFELRFTERLLLQFRQEESQEIQKIDIDHPIADQNPAIDVRIPLSDPEPPTLPSANTNQVPARPDPITKISDEWPSPAFIKRARTSYGSLFDTTYDPFAEEDDEGRGKRRKRTRLSSTWRYTSRSPSPEIEEPAGEFERSKSSEHVAEPKLTTTTDGGQSSNLKVDLFSGLGTDDLDRVTNRNMNLNSSITGSVLGETEAKIGAEATPLSSFDNTMQSPTIQNKPGKLVGGLIQDIEDASFGYAAPLSPPLPPVASDTLLLTSPVTELVEQEVMTEPSHNFTQQLASPIEDSTTSFPGGEHQDLYEIHRDGRSGEHPLPELHDLQVPVAGFSAVNSLHLEQHDLEDQHGHWQTAIAARDQRGRSSSSSPREARSDVRHEPEHFYLEVGHEEDHYFENGDLPMSRAHNSNHLQYPDLDDRVPGQMGTSSWGPESLSVASPYHPIPAVGSNNESANGHDPYPRSTSMSRSHSMQSAVVDLTEASDENERDGSLVPSVDEEEALEDDEGAKTRHNRYFPRKIDLESDDGDSEHPGDQGAAEKSYEDELEEEENYSKYPPSTYRHPADDFLSDEEAEASFDEEDVEGSYDEDEVEGSYDEEDIEDHQSPIQPYRELEVIDLLSSDDEDVGNEVEPNRSVPTVRSRTTPGEASVASTDDKSSDNDGGESAEDLDSANDVAFIQHPELMPARSREQLRERLPGGDDNRSTDEEAAEGVDYDESLSTSEDGDDREHQVEDDQDTEMAEPEHSNPIEESAEPSEADANEVEGGDPGHGPLETVQVSEDTNDISLELAEQEYNGNLARNYGLLEDDQEGRIDIDGVLDSTVDRTVELPISNASTQSHDIPPLSSISQLDGANDELRRDILDSSLRKDNDANSRLDAAKAEPLTDIPDPTLPEDKSMASAGAGSESKQDAEAMLPSDRENDQLPTPTNTQLSQMEDSQDLPLTFVNDVPPTASISQTVLSETSTDKILESELNFSVETKKNSNSETRNNFTVEGETLANEAVHDDAAMTRVDDDDVEESRNGILAQVATEQPAEIEADNDGLIRDEVTEISEDTIIVSPRKARKPQSASEVLPAARSSTPVRSGRELGPVELSRGRPDRSPSLVLDHQTTPAGHDASIELALSALESPTKMQLVLPKPRTADVKLRLSRALRTELSDFTALKVLRYHLNRKLDVLAIATSTPPEPKRASKGPRHYLITFNITDPSVAPTGVTEVQVFRPYKEALPIVEAGDGILLRNFQFTAVMGRGFALRSDQNEASSWAVFKGNENQAETRGPPVEYGDGEKNHIIALKNWYRSLDSVAMSKINRANEEKGTGVGKGTGKGS